jgi:nucleotide-binding universal stress UspA family protein
MELFKRILCPVDFSEYSSRALRYAVAFAQQHHSRLFLYHCLAPVPAAVYSEMPSGTQAWDDHSNERLEKLLKSFPAENLDAITKVDSGDPARRIVRIASEENIDLIVMGTHGAGGYEAFLMGSITNKVLHKTKTPLLAVCRPARAVLSGDPNEPLLIGKILCPLDPTDLRMPMLSRAMSLARFHRASILFLAVYPPGQPKLALEELKEFIQPENEKLCRMEFLESTGQPVEEILRTIREGEFDLAVLGHHRRMPMAMESLGSVTLRVIPRSNCPVLVIRD